MRKVTFLCLLVFVVSQTHAQLEVATMLGKYKAHHSFGYGAFLNFGKQVTDAGYATIEIAVTIFPEVGSGGQDGIIVIPAFVGYKHTLNGSGLGLYIQPQIGYNIAGAISNIYVDETFHGGFAWAGTLGYLFPPGNKIQFDIGLKYESILHSGGSINFLALRIAHSFIFGRRDEY
jgi:hypothetical protein